MAEDGIAEPGSVAKLAVWRTLAAARRQNIRFNGTDESRFGTTRLPLHLTGQLIPNRKEQSKYVLSYISRQLTRRGRSVTKTDSFPV